MAKESAAPGVGRRGLLRVLGGATGIAAFHGAISTRSVAAAQGTRVERRFERKRVGSVSALQPGRPEKIAYPDAGALAMLVRLPTPATGGVGPGGDIVAYSTICPHMGCPIEPAVDDRGMFGPCRCHFSCFDLAHDGLMSQGQATESLPRILLEQDGDDLYAVGVSGLLYGRHDNLAGGEG